MAKPPCLLVWLFLPKPGTLGGALGLKGHSSVTRLLWRLQASSLPTEAELV